MAESPSTLETADPNWLAQKILFGMMSDACPIRGSRHRIYIVLSGVVGVIGFVGLGTFCGDRSDHTSVLMVKWLLMLTSLSTAFCDVCADAMVATKAKLETEVGSGNLQSLCWCAYGVGGLLGSLVSSRLLLIFSPLIDCAG